VTTLAYKFLRAGAVGPFSGFRWPEPGPGGPGPWVEARAFRGGCGAGIHGCDADHLVYWLDEALWLIELDGEVIAADKKLIAPRGRLVRRVDAWGPALARRLADASIERARELAAGIEAGIEAERAKLARGYLADAIAYSAVDVAAGLFCAAHAALTEDGFARERAWQSRWLAAQLAA
jgi:hypothetical protein